MRRIALMLALPLVLYAQDDSVRAPAPMREFRGIWVATVNNIDWPSRPNLPVETQQAELLAILDRAAALRMNAIVFQVRPEFDALYESPYEPWSRYLTGRQGRAPSPSWDPLAFAVEESHRRGLELHAWVNPYRVAFYRDSLVAVNHIANQFPHLVRTYGQYLWLDPGLPESREFTLRAVVDIVRRYDIDGIHIDDYFYPYPEMRRGQKVDFPDDASWAAYRRSGGQLEKNDWRRNNVDALVRDLYTTVKAEKSWVKFGVSPFGIWRPGFPATTTAGIDQHDELFADVRKWLHEGWLDYLAPQLYWPIQPAEQSYPVLLQWWISENLKGREVWPGLALYKIPITGPRHISAAEIVRQVGLTRAQPGANGHVLFNTRVLMNNVDRIADQLMQAYREPALMPRMQWLDSIAPAKPDASIAIDSLQTIVARFQPTDSSSLASWLVQVRVDSAWRNTVLPSGERTIILSGPDSRADVISIIAVDRLGNLSPPAILRRTP